MSAPWVAVTAEDIQSRWRPLTEAEKQTASALILDAQDLLENRLIRDGVTAAPAGDDRWARQYAAIVSKMVRRVLRNPDGYVRERIDDYEYSRGEAEAAGELFLSDDEIADLVRPRGRRRGGAFTIRT